jgi:predicted CoA-binding protein
VIARRKLRHDASPLGVHDLGLHDVAQDAAIVANDRGACLVTRRFDSEHEHRWALYRACVQDLCALLARTHRIAVLGIKTEERAAEPAYAVPTYMQAAGFEIIPIPVYYPEATEILGQKVYRKVADVPGAVDMVNVFRKPSDLMAHLADILEKKPKAVWLQLGIRSDELAARLESAGIEVVQDRCIMVEHRACQAKR